MSNKENKKKENKNNKNNSNNSNNLYYILASIILIILIIATIWGYFYLEKNNKDNEVAYTDLIKEIENDKIEEIEMTTGSNTAKVKYKGIEEKKTVSIPNTEAFTELIQSKVVEGKNVPILNQKQINPMLKISSIFLQYLPTLVILAMVVLLFKMQGFGGEKKIYNGEENDTNVRFKDVAGLEEEKNELIEIVDFLKNPKRFINMGAKVPRGVLLCGKPGTGKTLIAKAVAGEAGVPFISMSGSEFIEMFAGLGASRVRKLFEKAKKVAPCIIFIDEIDAIGARRTSNSGAETENNQTLNQLLVEMDGFESNETVIVLAATNRPEMLDTALLRPGRFDRQITIQTPDVKGREEILKIHGSNKKLEEGLDFKSIAEDTAGFTGAELANVLNEAAIVATVNKHKAITQEDLDEAIKKVTVGIQKTSRVISEKDKKLTAYHEAGHAIVSKFLESVEDVKEISIIPRGFAGGYTLYKTDEDKFYISKTQMQEKLVALLGGRVAEKLAINDISTGASNDIEVATKIARDMVTIYGMSDTVGPISLKTDSPYELQLFGDNIEDIVGKEIKKLLDDAYKKAQIILSENMNILHEVAQVLLVKETITAEEFDQFFIQ